MREEFWAQDLSQEKGFKESLTNDYVQGIWSKFCQDPVWGSLEEIVEAASLQEALLTAPKDAGQNPSRLYRSINFDSKEKLESAIGIYFDTPTDLPLGERIDLVDRNITFIEKGFTSTTSDRELAGKPEGEGITFGGKFMITFVYLGKLDKGTFVDSWTNRDQQEFLFPLGMMKGLVLGIKKVSEGAFTVYCEIQ